MKKGVVTFIDVLGWKGIWNRYSDLNEPIHILKELIKTTREDIERLTTKAEKPFGTKIDVISVSDTIVLYSESSNIKLSVLHHSGVCILMMKKAFELGLFIRGAITYGSYSNIDEIFVGPAIDEVASWHEYADWVGVMVCPSVYLNLKSMEGFTEHEFLVEYDVPVKKGKVKTYAINWPEMYKRNMKETKCIHSVFVEYGTSLPEIYSKYENTLQFYQHIDKD